jgi:hypothetical protein
MLREETPDRDFCAAEVELSTSKGNFSFSLYNSASGHDRRRRIDRPSAPCRQPFDCRVFAASVSEKQQNSVALRFRGCSFPKAVFTGHSSG